MLFFFPSPATKFVLFFGLLVEFWWCLKRRSPEMCTFGVLWLLCEAPAARGSGQQKHHQNSTRRHPERVEKNEFCGERGRRKSEIWGGPGEGRSREGRSKPNLETNTHMKPHRVQGLGNNKHTTQHTTQHNATQRNATQRNTTQHNTTQHNTTNQVGFGQSRFGQTLAKKAGQSRFGQSRP